MFNSFSTSTFLSSSFCFQCSAALAISIISAILTPHSFDNIIITQLLSFFNSKKERLKPFFWILSYSLIALPQATQCDASSLFLTPQYLQKIYFLSLTGVLFTISRKLIASINAFDIFL